MKLSEGVEQAIHSVLMLAALDRGDVLPAVAIAEFHGVSTSYLLKHLRALTDAGIAESVPGPKGGYRLAKAPGQITLLDVVLAVEGQEPAFRCAEIRQRGPNPLAAKFYKAPCQVNAAMLRAEQVYRAELRKTAVSELLADSEPALVEAIEERTCRFLAHHVRPQS